MKGEKSKAGGNRTDNKLSVRKKRGGFKSKPVAVDVVPMKPQSILPQTGYDIFLGEFIPLFRKQFKKGKVPEGFFTALDEASRAKWNAMSDADKAPYGEIADKANEGYEERFEEYRKSRVAYYNKLAATKQESDKKEEVCINLASLIIRQ